jgi:outer membrane protein assembly factor BamB
MQMKYKFISIIVLLTVTSVFAADWPQYLGPNRDGISTQKNLLRSWPAEGPKVEWTVALGKGFGGPVVKDGKVYLLDRDDKVGDTMRCYDLSNGRELWNFGYNAPGTVEFPGSRSVPAIDGNNVYSCGHNGDLYCININTHKPVWNKNVWTDFGGDRLPMWAIAQCPLIYGDLLIVAPQAPQAGVIAYEKLTGQEKWKTPFLGTTGFNGYVSPSIVKVGQEDHLVTITASPGRSGGGGKVIGIAPLTGKILWEYTNFSCWIPVANAVDAGQGRLLITGSYNAGSVMLKVTKKDDGSYGVTELFKTVEFGSHTMPPVLYNGYFYVHYTTNERNDGLVCMSMDGKIMWKTERSPAFSKGCMILADGLILASDGYRSLYLIEPDPSKFKQLAKVQLLSDVGSDRRVGETNWAPMALSDGKLLIRDHVQMKCLTVAK